MELSICDRLKVLSNSNIPHFSLMFQEVMKRKSHLLNAKNVESQYILDQWITHAIYCLLSGKRCKKCCGEQALHTLCIGFMRHCNDKIVTVHVQPPVLLWLLASVLDLHIMSESRRTVAWCKFYLKITLEKHTVRV